MVGGIVRPTLRQTVRYGRGFEAGPALPWECARGRNAAPEFSPADIEGQEFWYRGDFLSDGTALDLSGNSRDAAPLAGTDAVTQTTEAGQLALTFDGQSALHATYGVVLEQPLTLYFVLRPSVLATTQFFFDSDDSTNRVWCEVDTAPRYRVSAGATMSTTSATTEITALCIVLNGVSSALYMNDFKSPAAADDAGQTGIDGVTLGTAFNGGSGFAGTIHDVIGYSGAHAASTRAKIASYATARYDGLIVSI